MDWSLGDALAWLDAHVNLEADRSQAAAQLRLDRIRQLVHVLGDPQHAYPVLHLTGTNGKGSTARMLTRLLVEQGLAVGTYTSPHLERLSERIAWNGEPISDEQLLDALATVARVESMLPSPPSFFEILTAAAFGFFAEVAVDAAVVEVGMGGRFDATNVADGSVAVITNVSLDHADLIGPTRADIATEKSGIVKPGATVVLGEDDPDLEELFARTTAVAGDVWRRGEHFACEENTLAVGGRLLTLRTPSATYSDVFLPLHGAHQGENAACALAAAEAFFAATLDPEVVNLAFADVTVPGRVEVVGRHPLTVLDGAHNAAGAAALGITLDEAFDVPGRRIVVFGTLGGHDPADLLAQLDPYAIELVVACEPPSPRAVPAAEVADAARRLGIAAVVEPDVAAAVARGQAAAGEDDLLLVTGSLYLIGAARPLLR